MGLRAATRSRRLGIARTFQNVHLFPNMTVLENAMVGQHCRSKAGVFGSILRTPAVRARGGADPRRAPAHALDFFGSRLAGYRQDQPAFVLSYANRRRLEMARALATEPALMLLDEPTAGMNPRETLELRDHIVRMRDELGLTVLVIEHDMRVVKGVSDRVIACDYGRKIAEGTYEEVANDEQVDRGLPRRAARGAAGERRPRRRAPVLELRNVSTHYGLVAVLRNVDMQIFAGEMVCLLGGNASGKTTTLKTILGYVTPSRGRGRVRGRDDLGPADLRGRAARHLDGAGEPAPVRRHDRRARTSRSAPTCAGTRTASRRDREQVLETFPRVRERLKQKAGTLSGGEQQMVAMGRALMADPKVLLMDEPSMGLAPVLVEQVFEIIEKIRELGRTVFVVEQNANMALSHRRPRLRDPDGRGRARRHGREPARTTRRCGRPTSASSEAACRSPSLDGDEVLATARRCATRSTRSRRRSATATRSATPLRSQRRDAPAARCC